MNSDNIRLYTIASYQDALLVIPLCALLGAFIVVGLGLKSRRNRRLF